MMFDFVVQAIHRLAREEPDLGPTGRTRRIGQLLRTVFEHHGGNAIEIGAGAGHTTVAMLKTAAAHGRTVLVIDPWDECYRESPYYRDVHVSAGYYGHKHKTFMEMVGGYEKHLIVHSRPSSCSSVPAAISQIAPIAFAFVDRLQLREAVLYDLRTMATAGVSVICVDDWDRIGAEIDVPGGVSSFLLTEGGGERRTKRSPEKC